MDEVEEYVNNYLKERKNSTLDNRKSLDKEKVLAKVKRQILNYRMYLIYNRIDDIIKDLNFSKGHMEFEYVENRVFVERLYKKISEINSKVVDLTSMIDQAENEGGPYDEIGSFGLEMGAINYEFF